MWRSRRLIAIPLFDLRLSSGTDRTQLELKGQFTQKESKALQSSGLQRCAALHPPHTREQRVNIQILKKRMINGF